MLLKRSRVDENHTPTMLHLTDEQCRDWLWMPRQVFFRSAKAARSIFGKSSIFITAERFEIENGDSAMTDAKQFLILQNL